MAGATIRRCRTDELSGSRVSDVRDLLDAAFDGEFTEEDWNHGTGGWHLLATVGQTVVGHAAVVDRVIRVDGVPFETGYVEAVAIRPDEQRQGLGSTLMTEVGRLIVEDHDLGALSTGLHGFYRRFGWELWHGPTAVQGPQGFEPTPEDDGGVMVLRFGTSAGVDLSAVISCEPRPGDDW